MQSRLSAEEKAFHRSRLMWAIVDDILYWTYSDLGHKEWLTEVFSITDAQFELIKRGYIRKETIDDFEVLNVVSYVGSEFRPVQLTELETKRLMWLIDIEYSYDKIEWYTGVKIGKPGEIWETIEHYDTTVRIKNRSILTPRIPLIYLLYYEHILTDYLNNSYLDSDAKRVVEREWKLLIDTINKPSKNIMNSPIGIEYRAYKYHHMH